MAKFFLLRKFWIRQDPRPPFLAVNSEEKKQVFDEKTKYLVKKSVFYEKNLLE